MIYIFMDDSFLKETFAKFRVRVLYKLSCSEPHTKTKFTVTCLARAEKMESLRENLT
jgi:hypothetical protein